MLETRQLQDHATYIYIYIYISQPYIFNPVTLWAPNMTPVQAVLQQQDTPTSSNYAFISLSKQSGQTKILSDIE